MSNTGLNFKIVKKDEQKISLWSGGTTTELSIYPEYSLYSNRDFLWRISTAVVDLEESTFTKLEGYNRILMVLSGKLFINHKGIKEITLNTFEQDSFYGGLDTVSKGKVTDFNLMMAKGVSGEVNAMLAGSTEILFNCINGVVSKTVSLYSLKNGVSITMSNGESFLLDVGDHILFNNDELSKNVSYKIQYPGSDKCIIKTSILY